MHAWDLWQAREVGQDRTRELDERVVAWCSAFEPYTALLLARSASSLPATVRTALASVEAHGDERHRVAGEAATRLGLERLHPFDDHGHGAATNDVPEAAFEEFIVALHAKAREHPSVALGDSEVQEALDQGTSGRSGAIGTHPRRSRTVMSWSLASSSSTGSRPSWRGRPWPRGARETF
jgi:hypothetical protein